MMIPPTHKILTDAAELIDGHFTKGRYVRRRRNGELCYCAVGAIHAALGFEVHENPDGILDFRVPSKPGVPRTACLGALHEARRALADHLGIRALALWNDAPQRTAHDVVAALRGAAAQTKATQ